MTRDAYAMVLLAAVIGLGCNRESPPPEKDAPVVSEKSAPVESRTTNAKVAKIVFVGQKEACECTRKRVDDSLAALEEALSGRGDIAVEKLLLDVDEAKVAVYHKLGAIMVPPAIYLLDSSGALIEMLQGEVTSEQIAIAIGR